MPIRLQRSIRGCQCRNMTPFLGGLKSKSLFSVFLPSFKLILSYVHLFHQLSGRSFSPITRGSIRDSIFSLINGTVGLGILNLPQRVGDTGVLISFFFIIMSFSLGIFSLESLNFASARRPFCNDYQSLVSEFCGPKTRFIFGFSTFCFTIGAAVANIVASSQLLNEVLVYSCPSVAFFHEKLFEVLLKGILGFVTCISFFFKRLPRLRFGYCFIILLLLFLIILLVSELPFFTNEATSPPKYEWVSFPLTPFGFFNLNAAYTAMTYSFLNQPLFLSLKNDLINSNMRRSSKIIQRGQLASLVFSLLVMVIGYFSFGQNAPDLILMRKAHDPSHDFLMKVGMALYSFYLFASVTVTSRQAKNTTASLLALTSSPPVDFWLSLFYTFSIVLLSCFVSDIKQIIDFLAGLFGTIISTTIPGLIFMASSKRFPDSRPGIPYYAVCFICSFFTVLGAASSILTIGLAIFPSRNLIEVGESF